MKFDEKVLVKIKKSVSMTAKGADNMPGRVLSGIRIKDKEVENDKGNIS